RPRAPIPYRHGAFLRTQSPRAPASSPLASKRPRVRPIALSTACWRRSETFSQRSAAFCDSERAEEAVNSGLRQPDPLTTRGGGFQGTRGKRACSKLGLFEAWIWSNSERFPSNRPSRPGRIGRRKPAPPVLSLEKALRHHESASLRFR